MRCQLAREIRFRSIGTEDIRQPEKKPPQMCHGLRLIQQKFVHEAREPAPALGLLLERSHTGPGDGVVLGVAIVFGLLPRAVDPPLLFESHEGGADWMELRTTQPGGPSVELLREPGASTTRITLYPRTTPGDPTLQPPKNTIMTTKLVVIMCVYSPRKNSANFMPLYSVW